MCLQRPKEDPENVIVFPFPMFEFIDLTEDVDEDAIYDPTHARWNAYHVLLSSDDDEVII